MDSQRDDKPRQYAVDRCRYGGRIGICHTCGSPEHHHRVCWFGQGPYSRRLYQIFLADLKAALREELKCRFATIDEIRQCKHMKRWDRVFTEGVGGVPLTWLSIAWRIMRDAVDGGDEAAEKFPPAGRQFEFIKVTMNDGSVEYLYRAVYRKPTEAEVRRGGLYRGRVYVNGFREGVDLSRYTFPEGVRVYDYEASYTVDSQHEMSDPSEGEPDDGTGDQSFADIALRQQINQTGEVHQDIRARAQTTPDLEARLLGKGRRGPPSDKGSEQFSNSSGWPSAASGERASEASANSRSERRTRSWDWNSAYLWQNQPRGYPDQGGPRGEAIHLEEALEWAMRPRVDRHGVEISGSWVCAVCDGKVVLDWNPPGQHQPTSYHQHVTSKEHRDKVRYHLLDTQKLFDEHREEEVRCLPGDPRVESGEFRAIPYDDGELRFNIMFEEMQARPGRAPEVDELGWPIPKELRVVAPIPAVEENAPDREAQPAQGVNAALGEAFNYRGTRAGGDGGARDVADTTDADRPTEAVPSGSGKGSGIVPSWVDLDLFVPGGDGTPAIGASPSGIDGPFIHKKSGETIWWSQEKELFFKVNPETQESEWMYSDDEEGSDKADDRDVEVAEPDVTDQGMPQPLTEVGLLGKGPTPDAVPVMTIPDDFWRGFQRELEEQQRFFSGQDWERIKGGKFNKGKSGNPTGRGDGKDGRDLDAEGMLILLARWGFSVCGGVVVPPTVARANDIVEARKAMESDDHPDSEGEERASSAGSRKGLVHDQKPPTPERREEQEMAPDDSDSDDENTYLLLQLDYRPQDYWAIVSESRVLHPLDRRFGSFGPEGPGRDVQALWLVRGSGVFRRVRAALNRMGIEPQHGAVIVAEVDVIALYTAFELADLRDANNQPLRETTRTVIDLGRPFGSGVRSDAALGTITDRIDRRFQRRGKGGQPRVDVVCLIAFSRGFRPQLLARELRDVIERDTVFCQLLEQIRIECGFGEVPGVRGRPVLVPPRMITATLHALAGGQVPNGCEKWHIAVADMFLPRLREVVGRLPSRARTVEVWVRELPLTPRRDVPTASLSLLESRGGDDGPRATSRPSKMGVSAEERLRTRSLVETAGQALDAAIAKREEEIRRAAEQVTDPGRDRETTLSRPRATVTGVTHTAGIRRRKSLGETVGSGQAARSALDMARMELFRASKSWEQVIAELPREDAQPGPGPGGDQPEEAPSAGPVPRVVSTPAREVLRQELARQEVEDALQRGADVDDAEGAPEAGRAGSQLCLLEFSRNPEGFFDALKACEPLREAADSLRSVGCDPEPAPGSLVFVLPSEYLAACEKIAMGFRSARYVVVNKGLKQHVDRCHAPYRGRNGSGRPGRRTGEPRTQQADTVNAAQEEIRLRNRGIQPKIEKEDATWLLDGRILDIRARLASIHARLVAGQHQAEELEESYKQKRFLHDAMQHLGRGCMSTFQELISGEEITSDMMRSFTEAQGAATEYSHLVVEFEATIQSLHKRVMDIIGEQERGQRADTDTIHGRPVAAVEGVRADADNLKNQGRPSAAAVDSDKSAQPPAIDLGDLDVHWYWQAGRVWVPYTSATVRKLEASYLTTRGCVDVGHGRTVQMWLPEEAPAAQRPDYVVGLQFRDRSHGVRREVARLPISQMDHAPVEFLLRHMSFATLEKFDWLGGGAPLLSAEESGTRQLDLDHCIASMTATVEGQLAMHGRNFWIMGWEDGPGPSHQAISAGAHTNQGDVAEAGVGAASAGPVAAMTRAPEDSEEVRTLMGTLLQTEEEVERAGMVGANEEQLQTERRRIARERIQGERRRAIHGVLRLRASSAPVAPMPDRPPGDKKVQAMDGQEQGGAGDAEGGESFRPTERAARRMARSVSPALPRDDDGRRDGDEGDGPPQDDRREAGSYFDLELVKMRYVFLTVSMPIGHEEVEGNYHMSRNQQGEFSPLHRIGVKRCDTREEAEAASRGWDIPSSQGETSWYWSIMIVRDREDLGGTWHPDCTHKYEVLLEEFVAGHHRAFPGFSSSGTRSCGMPGCLLCPPPPDLLDRVEHALHHDAREALRERERQRNSTPPNPAPGVSSLGGPRPPRIATPKTRAEPAAVAELDERMRTFHQGNARKGMLRPMTEAEIRRDLCYLHPSGGELKKKSPITRDGKTYAEHRPAGSWSVGSHYGGCANGGCPCCMAMDPKYDIREVCLTCRRQEVPELQRLSASEEAAAGLQDLARQQQPGRVETTPSRTMTIPRAAVTPPTAPVNPPGGHSPRGEGQGQEEERGRGGDGAGGARRSRSSSRVSRRRSRSAPRRMGDPIEERESRLPAPEPTQTATKTIKDSSGRVRGVDVAQYSFKGDQGKGRSGRRDESVGSQVSRRSEYRRDREPQRRRSTSRHSGGYEEDRSRRGSSRASSRGSSSRWSSADSWHSRSSAGSRGDDRGGRRRGSRGPRRGVFDEDDNVSLASGTSEDWDQSDFSARIFEQARDWEDDMRIQDMPNAVSAFQQLHRIPAWLYMMVMEGGRLPLPREVRSAGAVIFGRLRDILQSLNLSPKRLKFRDGVSSRPPRSWRRQGLSGNTGRPFPPARAPNRAAPAPPAPPSPRAQPAPAASVSLAGDQGDSSGKSRPSAAPKKRNQGDGNSEVPGRVYGADQRHPDDPRRPNELEAEVERQRQAEIDAQTARDSQLARELQEEENRKDPLDRKPAPSSKSKGAPDPGDDDSDDGECPICREGFKEDPHTASFPCLSLCGPFHKRCLGSFFHSCSSRSNVVATCPLCRSKPSDVVETLSEFAREGNQEVVNEILRELREDRWFQASVDAAERESGQGKGRGRGRGITNAPLNRPGNGKGASWPGKGPQVGEGKGVPPALVGARAPPPEHGYPGVGQRNDRAIVRNIPQPTYPPGMPAGLRVFLAPPMNAVWPNLRLPEGVTSLEYGRTRDVGFSARHRGFPIVCSMLPQHNLNNLPPHSVGPNDDPHVIVFMGTQFYRFQFPRGGDILVNMSLRYFLRFGFEPHYGHVTRAEFLDYGFGYANIAPNDRGDLPYLTEMRYLLLQEDRIDRAPSTMLQVVNIASGQQYSHYVVQNPQMSGSRVWEELQGDLNRVGVRHGDEISRNHGLRVVTVYETYFPMEGRFRWQTFHYSEGTIVSVDYETGLVAYRREGGAEVFEHLFRSFGPPGRSFDSREEAYAVQHWITGETYGEIYWTDRVVQRSPADIALHHLMMAGHRHRSLIEARHFTPPPWVVEHDRQLQLQQGLVNQQAVPPNVPAPVEGPVPAPQTIVQPDIPWNPGDGQGLQEGSTWRSGKGEQVNTPQPKVRPIVRPAIRPIVRPAPRPDAPAVMQEDLPLMRDRAAEITRMVGEVLGPPWLQGKGFAGPPNQVEGETALYNYNNHLQNANTSMLHLAMGLDGWTRSVHCSRCGTRECPCCLAITLYFRGEEARSPACEICYGLLRGEGVGQRTDRTG